MNVCQRNVARFGHVECRFDKIRACLHGGGGPRVGEVTRLAVVEK